MSVLFLAEINDGQLAEDGPRPLAQPGPWEMTLSHRADVSSAAEQASKLEGRAKSFIATMMTLDMIWQSRQTSLPPLVLYAYCCPATASAKISCCVSPAFSTL